MIPLRFYEFFQASHGAEEEHVELFARAPVAFEEDSQSSVEAAASEIIIAYKGKSS